MKLLDVDITEFPMVKIHAGLLALVGGLIFIGTLLM